MNLHRGGDEMRRAFIVISGEHLTYKLRASGPEIVMLRSRAVCVLFNHQLHQEKPTNTRWETLDSQIVLKVLKPIFKAT